MDIPLNFHAHISAALGIHAADFLSALGSSPFTGLRVNTLKCNIDVLEKFFNNLKPTPFCENGFYTGEEKLGNHPLHHAGAFYIQEPSAMSAVTALAPQPGERVLDLCASPGGKTTQIAAAMQGKGVLFSNEYVAGRVAALVSNVERCGITNCIITNESAERLCAHFGGYFDRVLVDAPCSGEGMIRKDPDILKEWNIENVRGCAARQKTILQAAAQAVRPGGTLCYSTCTLAREENEEVVLDFLQRHRNFELAPIEAQFGMPAFNIAGADGYNLEYARRILPQHGGEGHFVALMREKSTFSDNGFDIIPQKRASRGCDNSPKKAAGGQISPIEAFLSFYNENFEPDIDFEKNTPISVGDRVFIAPQTPPLTGLAVVRAGLFAGNVQKNRFVPSHALFNRAGAGAKRVAELPGCSAQVKKFLHGEEIECDADISGFCLVTTEGIPLGFGKASGGRLKNHYPKGLRTLNI